MTPVKNAKNTMRGRVYLMKNVPKKRPTAKAPCAPASILDPVALDVFGLVSVA